MKDIAQKLAKDYSAADLKAAFMIRMDADSRSAQRQNPNYFCKLERLGLTTRAFRVLNHRKIYTIDQLVENYTEQSISMMKGCGRQCIEDIRHNLKRFGLKLRRDRIQLLEFASSLFAECDYEFLESDFPCWFIYALKKNPAWIVNTGRQYDTIYAHVIDLVSVCLPNIEHPEVFLAEKGFEL